MATAAVEIKVLWDRLQNGSSSSEVLHAARTLVELLCEGHDFHNAAEAILIAAKRMDSMDAKQHVDEWLDSSCQTRRFFWEMLLGQEFFLKWIEKRELGGSRHRWSLRDPEHDVQSSKIPQNAKLDFRATERQSIPIVCRDDPDLITACSEVFAELKYWLESHPEWSLGGMNAVIALNRSRRGAHNQCLWNPATFGIRFIDPGCDIECSSLLNCVAEGQVKVISVSLGSSPPGGSDVLD